MDRFDAQYEPVRSSEATDSSNYHRVGTTIKADEQGESFTATFTVDQELTDTWLPLAGAATGVSFANDADNGNDTFYYNTDTDSAIIPAGTRKGLTYTESGIIARNPTDKQISSAAAARITQPEAQDVPDSASKLATSIAGGQSSGGAAATALADTLKDSGWFSHGLEGDYPSDAGHGNYRINKLLAGTAMVGDSEQYASAMALMARDLGLPSRVVLGSCRKTRMAKSPMPARRRPRAMAPKSNSPATMSPLGWKSNCRAWDGWRSIRRPRRPRCLMKTRT